MKAETLRKLAELNLAPEQMAGVLDILADLQEDEEKRKADQRDRVRKHRMKQTCNVTETLHEGYNPSPKCSSPTPPSPNPQPIPPSPPKGGSSPTEIDTVVEAFTETAKRSGLSVPRSIDKRRRQAILIRLRESGLPAILEAISKIGASRFCCGENDRGWRADIDFLLQPKSFTALLEGKYDNRRKTQAPGRERTILDVIDERLDIANANIFDALRTIDAEPSRREPVAPDLRLIADASRH